MRLSDIPERPLQIVYFDHVKIEDYVVDERTGETGYPWLTLAIDANTRMIAGFHLSLAPPSRVSLSLCLLHAVCDKARWMNARGLTGDWPAAGLPETIAIDPQSIFGFRQLARAWRDQGIATASESIRSSVFGVRATHMFGGRFGKVAVAKANGVSWTPRAPRHLRRALARDIRELEFAVGDGLVNDYHHRAHKDTGRTPLDGWREAVAAAPLRAPQDCMRFRLSLLPDAVCALSSSGVSVLGETFWSPGLARLHREGRERVAVKFDPRDLSRIFVQETGKGSMEAANVAATDGGASDEACRRNCKLLVPSLRSRDADRRGADSAPKAGCGGACPERSGHARARRAARTGDDEGSPKIDRTTRLQYARMPPASAGALHQTGDADS
ncbi:Mu transposase C-terminal domain-containing protein [Methylocystis sp. SC2]|uniref:Mu transposase C-terminal domain-containing protein n=1 Tax=Methylocystis sp. (strain SC2) TaxID=187303 RepID=UPI00027AEB3D|nr:Mu transposase C-terminal domain-containing protein [Methylocystis sp. SC2]CCJ05651.1 Transposase [Methylocystis sp. SC2]